ncbi:hypothetical protein Daus18300_011906 [Diaporthe australafricana]|uniref:FAD-binding domain-containing protein n=1 Tax=Diaporthe australafricana TaxID=127596 RepID=A0ABR3W4R1_9PEZI
MIQGKFRAIVVGGGPVGLTAAHALSRAGIEYIVLEARHSVTIDVGASLALWPQGLRVLSQLGLLDRLRELGEELGRTTSVTLSGHKYKETWATKTMKKKADIVTLLYESLSEADKACILLNKTVTNIVADNDGVEVRCGDGSIYHGSILIGADGVHSKVRQAIRESAIKASSPRVNEEKPYLSEYKVMWCTFPRQPSMEPGDTFEIHGKDVSLQCLNGQKRSWLFIYERLEKPTRERMSYSQKDFEAFAERHSDLAISEQLKVRDVSAKRYTAGMSNLEEGIVKHWSHGRMVLVGDSCHKFTPNQGLGYNNGVQDIVALVNELNRAIKADDRSNSADMPLDILGGVFSRYQAARMELLRADYNSSASWTRMSAWSNWAYRLLDRYIFPAIPNFDDFMVTHLVSGLVSKTVVLDFVESEEPFQGKVPWKHAMRAPNIKSTP